MKTIKILAILFAIAIIGQSCRKESDEIIVTPPITEPEIKVTSSVLGTVIDNNGISVEGAMVAFEDQVTFTDDNGVFQFNDEQLYSSGTYIKVSKEGFFDGSRRFYASEGNTSIVAIELMPMEEVAEFSSTDGSNITFDNVELNFKANSIMNEDGSAYSGNVNIAAKYLDPTLVNTLNQMPGDLTGTSADQNRVVLTSMAMIAVELLDDNGNKLQVQDGNTVDVKIPVPNALLNDAPETIPMWHFNEEVGTWVEEGFANLVNGKYEASLPHFSFWNCDIPNDYIFLKGSIENRGIPIQGANVVVTVGNGTSGSAITGQDGFFCGFVPNGEELTLKIYDQCGNLIYIYLIPPSDEDILLEPINLSIEVNVASLFGSISLCNGTPSPQSYVNVSQGTQNSVIVINDDYTFSTNIFYCEEGSEISVWAIDPVNALSSTTFEYDIDGDIDVEELELCDDQIIPISILEYGDVYINSATSSDVIGFSVESDTLSHNPLHVRHTINIVNWTLNEFHTVITFYDDEDPLQSGTVIASGDGFEASGIASTIKVDQDGQEFTITEGNFSDITITDSQLYDPSYDEVYFYIVIKS